MNSNPTISLQFAPDTGGTGRVARWLKLEQVEQDTPTATLADAARIIDDLFDTDPCESGDEGTGGEESNDEDIPEEEEFYETARETLLEELCNEEDEDEDNSWTAEVDIFHSHQTPDCRLLSESAKIESIQIMRQTRTERQTLENATSLDLEYPYYQGISVTGATVTQVLGSTVFFAAPVSGTVTVRYESIWERATVKIPLVPDGEGTPQRESAAVVCFWAELAAACDINPPAENEGEDQIDLEKLCRDPNTSWHGSGDCWKTIRHFFRCTCSGSEAAGYEWTEEVSAPCPKGTGHGAHLGTEAKLDGYVWCPEEEDRDLPNPEYYKKRCCHYPATPSDLPRCRRTYAAYSGGAEISGGAQSWLDAYGEGTSLVAVSPESGTCGELVHEWEVPQKNCCNEITPMSPSPGNPEAFHAGEMHRICVQDGKGGTYKWRASGGLYFLQHGKKVYQIETGTCADVYAEASGVCPQPKIIVDDGCQPLRMAFIGGAASKPSLPADLVAAPGQRFRLAVSGGVPPYMWQIGGQIKLISTGEETGNPAIFEATDDFCGAEQITAVDTCGQSATLTVRSTRGGWEMVPESEYDQCNPPGAPFETEMDSRGKPKYGHMSHPSGGYRAMPRDEGFGDDSTQPHPNPEEILICPEGNLVTVNGGRYWAIECFELCLYNENYTVCNYSNGLCFAQPRLDEIRDHRDHNSERVLRLEKWVCKNE